LCEFSLSPGLLRGNSESKGMVGIFSLCDWQHCWSLVMLYLKVSDMLRVWFICSPFVPNECVVKMVPTLEVCTKDE
jgi:hypothetical protein